MLKTLALQQGTPVGVHPEAERKLRLALSRAGVLCDEALICGAEPEIYLTASSDAAGDKIRAVAEGALGYRVTVAAKHALSAGKNCWLLRRLPRFDAAFGIASATKAGETASGDTCLGHPHRRAHLFVRPLRRPWEAASRRGASRTAPCR